MFGCYFVSSMQYPTKCPLKFCNHLDEEERAGCFTIIVFWRIITVNVLWLFIGMPWVGLQCAIVEFPDTTHLTCLSRVLPGMF